MKDDELKGSLGELYSIHVAPDGTSYSVNDGGLIVGKQLYNNGNTSNK